MLDVALADGALAWLSTMADRAAHAPPLPAPPGGTNLGILDNGGPPGEAGWGTVTDG